MASKKYDHPSVLKHFKADSKLVKAMKKVGPFPLRARRNVSPYEALFRSVVYQQLTGKAAATILGRVCALFGDSEKIPAPELFLKTADQDLRSAGLSGGKTKALKDLAQKTIEGKVPSSKELAKKTDEEIVALLTEVHGVGPWTVEMFLMFTLGRLDVLPVKDLGVRKGYAKLYGKRQLPSDAQLLKHGEKWRPYRSVAAWYMWQVVDLDIV